jgi:hypothetical protein
LRSAGSQIILECELTALNFPSQFGVYRHDFLRITEVKLNADS